MSRLRCTPPEKRRSSQLKMCFIGRGDLFSAHQPFHGHFPWNLHCFHPMERTENAIPETGGNAMVHLWLVEMMIEVMLPENDEGLGNRSFLVKAGMRGLIQPIHSHQSQ